MLVLASMAAIMATDVARAEDVTVEHDGTSVTLSMTEVGDPGNAADASSFTGDYGDVDYVYDIGKYEISVSQWDTAMGAAPLAGHSWSGDQPVANVRLFEAAKFCNWLTSGDPAQGVYTLGALPTVTAIDRAGALATYGEIWVLPTNDEWHKAAYYVATSGTYQKHPTGEARPTAVTGGTAANTAVYTRSGEASPTAPADIDNAGALSPYGTMAQGGNVAEYVEGLVVDTGPYFRGGPYASSDYMFRNTTTQFGPGSTWNANATTGFRVVRLVAVVPPPEGTVVSVR
jgi:formylglycine-generating enzyme required for sulfatase activity